LGGLHHQLFERKFATGTAMPSARVSGSIYLEAALFDHFAPFGSFGPNEIAELARGAVGGMDAHLAKPISNSRIGRGVSNGALHASALALVLGLVMIVGRSVWRCFAMWEPTRTEALAGQMGRAYSFGCLAQANKSLA
jgi:hypothetical protein